MSDALDRINAQVEARRAAVGDAPPVAPPAPAPDAAPDPSSQIADLQAALVDLADRVSVLEDAAIEDAMEDVPEMVDPSAMVAAATAAAAESAPE